MSYLPCELHCHTIHSDGDFTVSELQKAAVDDHLAIIALTDHNTFSGWDELDDNIIPAIRGIEWTTYFGHMLVLGANDFVDWRDAQPDNIDEKINAMTDPRSVGAGSTDLSQIVSGIVRPGDTIDIYVIANKNNGENYYTTPDKEDMLYSNVYVLDAFDSAGTPIMNGDSTSVCERINFLMENSEINNYYNAITDSTVYYVKHID